MNATRSTVVNFVWFQAAWWGVVLLAQKQFFNVSASLLITILLLTVHFIVFYKNAKRDLQLMLVIGAMGYALDSLLFYLGVFSFFHASPPLAPLWIFCLWLVFPLSLPYSMNWLQGRLALALVFGAVGGPVTYFAGEKLSLMEFMNPKWGAFLILAVVWAVLIIVLLKILKIISLKAERRAHGN